MSVAGIASSLFDYASQSINSTHHQTQFQQDFLQLGRDIQAGNLTAAQSDLTALEKLRPASSDTTSPITQAFQQLSTDLQSGNVSAAQQDYSAIQQAFQDRAAHVRHRHDGGGSDTIDQLLQQLNQALQSGKTSQAQQTYATLQQNLQQFAQTHGLSASEGTSTASAVSVNA